MQKYSQSANRNKARPRKNQSSTSRWEQPTLQRINHLWFQTRGKTAKLWVGTVFLLHSLGLVLLFEPLAGLVSKESVIEQDWGLHFHHLQSMVGFWRQDGRLWGYNPFFMAGYPSNTIQDLSIKTFEVLSLPLTAFGLDSIQGFKLVVFIAAASVPWIMFFAARNFFREEAAGLISAALAGFLGTLYWWNSLPREMFFYGMVSFPPACYFSLYALSLFYRILWAERFSSSHVAWLAAAVAILPMHVLASIVLLPAAIALLIARGELPRRSNLLWIAVALVLSFLVNAPWLIPVFSHRGDDVSSAIVNQLPLFTSLDPLTFLKDYLSPTSYWSFRSSVWERGLRLMLLVLGLMGAFRLMRAERKELGMMVAFALASLFVLTYFGSLIPVIKGWQPLRFKLPYDLFLVLTASYLVAARATKSIFIPVLLICGATAFLINLGQTESKNTMRLRTRILPEIKEIVDWIRNEAPKDGRVLFEESGDETGFVYNGMYLSAFIPHWTGHQMIGGPINLYNDRHHFAEFHSGILFKRDISQFRDKELQDYFHTYNIAAVVTFHPRSVQRLLSVPELVSPEHRVGPVHLLKVKQRSSWLLKGEGNIQASLNVIRGSSIRGKEIILKYHWTDGLVSNPPLRIAPEKVLDDPIPFIKIVNPPAEFTLRIGG
ncbi:MAG: hypothetical protein HY695_31165 [Deltaproteobacteria bacterium]|nr:hypothetical protein [Deltaproteobacteria bacterium]